MRVYGLPLCGLALAASSNQRCAKQPGEGLSHPYCWHDQLPELVLKIPSEDTPTVRTVGIGCIFRRPDAPAGCFPGAGGRWAARSSGSGVQWSAACRQAPSHARSRAFCHATDMRRVQCCDANSARLFFWCREGCGTQLLQSSPTANSLTAWPVITVFFCIMTVDACHCTCHRRRVDCFSH